MIFYGLFVCGHYFFNTSLCKSLYSTFYFGKLVFHLSVFYVFPVMSFEFNVIFSELGKGKTSQVCFSQFCDGSRLLFNV